MFNFHKSSTDIIPDIRNFVRRRSSKKEPVVATLSKSSDHFFERKRHSLTHPITRDLMEKEEVEEGKYTTEEGGPVAVAGSGEEGARRENSLRREHLEESRQARKRIKTKRKTNERHTIPHPLVRPSHDLGEWTVGPSPKGREPEGPPLTNIHPLEGSQGECQRPRKVSPQPSLRRTSNTTPPQLRRPLHLPLSETLPSIQSTQPSPPSQVKISETAQKSKLTFPTELKVRRVKDVPPLPSPNRVPTQSRSSSDIPGLNRDAEESDTSPNPDPKEVPDKKSSESSESSEEEQVEAADGVPGLSGSRKHRIPNKRTRSRSYIVPVTATKSAPLKRSPPPSDTPASRASPAGSGSSISPSVSDTPLSTFISQNPTIDYRQPIQSRSRPLNLPLGRRKAPAPSPSPEAREAPLAAGGREAGGRKEREAQRQVVQRQENVAIKSRDWNLEFQELVSSLRNAEDDNSHIELSKKLCALGRDFLTVARVCPSPFPLPLPLPLPNLPKLYGKIIISEYCLEEEFKTIHTVSLAGMAGGPKYICNGILFKVSVPLPPLPPPLPPFLPPFPLSLFPLPLPSSLFPLPSSLFPLPSSLFPLPSSLLPPPSTFSPSLSNSP
jgi:hypothetical protein